MACVNTNQASKKWLYIAIILSYPQLGKRNFEQNFIKSVNATAEFDPA
jgi:hypothetical protein